MTKITLKNVASYNDNPVIIETDKKVNLIYGLNGAGKTVISNFLYQKNNPSDDMDFSDCELDGVSDEKILVYNQTFIRDNFYSTDELKGIFTLSKKNKEVEEAINIANEKKQKLTETKEKLKANDLNNKQQSLTNEEERIKNILWKIKTKYTGGDRVLAFCLDGLQRKDLVFDHIMSINKLNTQPNKTTEDLRKEAKTISDDAQKQDLLPEVNIDISSIETNEIFSEVIVGNEDSPVSALITTLKNSDWVKQGLNYLPNNSEQCPFCQEKTITQQVATNIRNYFDETYDNKISQIKDLQHQYNAIQLPEITQYKNHDFVKENSNEFEILYKELSDKIEKNKDNIIKKLSNLSQKITLDNTNDALTNLNKLISETNQTIEKHNQKIDNKTQTKQEIKDTFWQIMRWDYDTQITQYEEDKTELNNAIKVITVTISKHTENIRLQENIIQKQQRQMINIDEAITNINTGLNDLGIEGFNIKKYEDKYYKISRGNQEDDNFKTLSEGEKMIISFFYFMELCKGKESEQDTNTQSNKIIVIDDPISSLSHIYIFNISQLIKKFFFKTYKQVFVLTHSLYFFHELIRAPENKKLFRLTKSSNTQIQEMNENEIQNDYQAYWQVIKDHNHNKASDALLTNSMRNILEHFFGFIDKNKLSEVIKDLNNNRFNAFERYINRESHSDLTNITDYKDIDVELFKEAFKGVFDKAGYIEHYNKMTNTAP